MSRISLSNIPLNNEIYYKPINETHKTIKLAPKYFGEGIATDGKKIVQLTWKEETAFVYDLITLKLEREFRYKGEGWGLTFDGKHYIKSDGSAVLTFHHPTDFSIIEKIKVTLDGDPLPRINELEYVEGALYANIWYENWIAKIDPTTGRVLEMIDCREIVRREGLKSNDAVLNGIAYDTHNKMFFLTGKNWKNIYLCRLIQKNRDK